MYNFRIITKNIHSQFSNKPKHKNSNIPQTTEKHLNNISSCSTSLSMPIMSGYKSFCPQVSKLFVYLNKTFQQTNTTFKHSSCSFSSLSCNSSASYESAADEYNNTINQTEGLFDKVAFDRNSLINNCEKNNFDIFV